MLGMRRVMVATWLHWLPGLRAGHLATSDVSLMRREGRRFERRIPSAELRYLNGLRRVPASADPELLARAITVFAGRSVVRPAPEPRAAAPASARPRRSPA
jgi:hypothetical protein